MDLSVAHLHYENSCHLTKEAEKTRNNLLLYIIIALLFLFLQIRNPVVAKAGFESTLTKLTGSSWTFETSFIQSAIWLVLFLLVLRYYQLCAYIERMYKYVHKLEKRLSELSGTSDFFDREGREYVSDYPVLLNWVWLVYTIIIPIILIAAVILKNVIEMQTPTMAAEFWLNRLLSICIVLTTVFYLILAHFNK